MLSRLHVGVLPLIYSPVQNLSQVLKKHFKKNKILLFFCACACAYAAYAAYAAYVFCASSYRLLVLILVLWASTLLRYVFLLMLKSW